MHMVTKWWGIMVHQETRETGSGPLPFQNKHVLEKKEHLYAMGRFVASFPYIKL